MSTWSRVAGDIGDTLTVRLDGVADLTGVESVVATVTNDADPADTDTLDAALTSASERTVTVALGAWLTAATPGTYWLRYRTSWAGGVVLSWPEGHADSILVTGAAE